MALRACQDARAVYEAGSPEFVLLMRLPFYESGDTAIVMRSPCRTCGVAKGLLRKKGTQDTVWCAACGGYAYNAPRHEAGL